MVHYRELMPTLCKYLLSCHLKLRNTPERHCGTGNALFDVEQKPSEVLKLQD